MFLCARLWADMDMYTDVGLRFSFVICLLLHHCTAHAQHSHSQRLYPDPRMGKMKD